MREYDKIEKMLDDSNRLSYQNQLIEFVTQVVCKYYEIPLEKLMSKDRKREIVKARQVIMHLLLKNSKLSLSVIGKRFNKDHATVIHSNKVVLAYLDWDKVFMKEVEELQNVISLKARSLVDNVSLDKDFYFIDLNNFYSIKLKNGKGIILAGYTQEEIDEFIKINAIDEKEREHKNKGTYILEPNTYEENKNS